MGKFGVNVGCLVPCVRPRIGPGHQRNSAATGVEFPASKVICREVTTMSVLARLEKGRLYRFDDWPTGDLPRIAAGVYTIWRGTEFVYVGMAGRGNAETKEQAKMKG